jgi:hypothetical protein
MKKFLAALLLLSGVAVMANLAFAIEDFGSGVDGMKLSTAKIQALNSRAAKLGSSAVVGDTTYVGYTPGKFSATKNWWSIGSGFSPGGSNSPSFRRAPAQGAMWDFEVATNPAQWGGDSLQGWWPIRALMNGTGGQTRPDWDRVWWSVEVGNTANYILNAGHKRTFGVVGVWHRDGGSAAPASTGATSPAWAPIGGSFSAWMGLRGAADANAPVDAVTGNPFTENVLKWSTFGSASLFGSDNKFPGYGSQMDQMLYRDIDMTGFTGSDLTVGYSYRLKMSTGFGNAAISRTGWFDKDPLQVAGGGLSNSAVGNYISATDAGDAGTPRDSFTVYIGAPVGSSFLASDGTTYPVFDPQRRWFSEVVRANEGLFKQIDRDTGTVALATKSATIPNSVLAPILAASGGKVRLVFRVHTNRGFDDQGTAFNSLNQGAAVLDNVTYSISGGGGSSPAGWGTFESATSIDNAVGVDPINAWKSTGKPPSAYPHAHALADLIYADLCGQPGDPTRVCNMLGNVVSFGNHDESERVSGQTDGTQDREMWGSIFSPTIQLRSDNGAWPNPVGLVNPTAGDDPQDPYASEEYFLDTDIYMGVFDPFTKGVLWRAGIASYPARDRNTPTNKVWGNVRYLPYIIYNPDQQCVRDFGDHNVVQNGMLVWDQAASESSDFPDSVVMNFGIRQECYRFGVSTGCASPDGAYWDNISFMIVDGIPAPIGASIWDLYQDAFPQNETPGLPAFAAQFDTCTALVKTGLNIAPSTGLTRFDVPGDSTAVVASQSEGDTRVDMIFRILPGPGNYTVIGRPDLGTLVKNPATSGGARVAIAGPVANSTNFWESYLANNGPKGTPGGHAGGVWNPNVWNSARCDTSEVSGLFSLQGRGVLGGPGTDLAYDTRMHEQEIGIGTGDAFGAVTNIRGGLTIPRRRCFIASAGASTADIDCVHDVGTSGTGYNLSYVSTAAGTSNPATGYNGASYNVGSGVVPNGSWTVEGSKIIPDGLLTAGSSVQYFFRKEDSANLGVNAGMMPDTTQVFPQNAEGSFDAHRWQYFSVLPDRWKDADYRHPVLGTNGAGEACMLVFDNNDRRGDERAWVGVADTIGATRAPKYGAHNGWHAAGGQDIEDPAARVAANLGIPGTTWDMYNVKASESLTTGAGSIGNRFAFRNPANPQIDIQHAVLGPTPEMMATFYKVVFLMSGDLNSGILGPFLNKSQDDTRLLQEWLAAGNPSAADRGFHAMGNGFVESNYNEGPGADQDVFNVDYLGLTLRNNSYALASGNLERAPDLLASPDLNSGHTVAPGVGDYYGVQGLCLWTNDVLERTAGLIGETDDLVKYEDAGPGPFPLTSTVRKSWSSANPWISVVDGYDILNLRSRFDTDTKARSRYFLELYTNIFNDVCNIYGTPVIPLDVPAVTDLRQFVELAGTPMRNGGRAHIKFALTQRLPVQIDIYDVSGREVRAMANRTFEAGQHELLWDGTDNSGRQVARGVYFTQVKLGAEKTARKVIVLN